MLLALGKRDFAVDTNVGRICARCALPPGYVQVQAPTMVSLMEVQIRRCGQAWLDYPGLGEGVGTPGHIRSRARGAQISAAEVRFPDHLYCHACVQRTI